MNSDIPCGASCANRHCPYNAFGQCFDNATCEEQTGGEARQ